MRARTGRWMRPPAPEHGPLGLLRRHGMGRAVVWIDNRLGRYLLPVLTLLRTRSGTARCGG